MEMIATGFGLAEAPTWCEDGSLLVSDVLGGGVRRLRLDGEQAEVPEGRRRGIGGIALDERGGVIVSGRDVVRLRADGEAELLLAREEPVTGFNDIAATPEGGLLAGALHFAPFGGGEPVPGTLRHRAPDGTTRVWSTGVLWPNGIGFSPDGATVYVCDYAAGVVLRGAWDPDAEGVLEPFWSSPSGHCDGLAVAADGSVMVALAAGGGVAWIDQNGIVRQRIDVPATFVASVCFAGVDLSELIVTTLDNTVRPDEGGAVFRWPAPVPGAPVPRYRG